jgi:RNA polymerase sigma-70 factor (ECF subfamily)
VGERPSEFRELPGPQGLPDAATTIRLFEQALKTHSRRLLAIARSIAGNRAGAEDIVQQAMTNLYEHRDRYDWREPGGLMRRAVVNEALRILRQPRMTLVGEDHPSTHAEPMVGMLDRETIAKVRGAIDRLPEHFRAALVLCEYENMPYAQIADVLDCSIPQVKTWLHRGRKQLARMLADFAIDSDSPDDKLATLRQTESEST